MRYVLALLVLLLALACSCKKEKDTANYGLYGKWQWDSSAGGLAYTVYTPQSTGKVIVIQFLTDKSYKWYVNDTFSYQARFQLHREYSFLSGQTEDMVVYDDNPLRHTYYLNDTRLLLREEAYDGFNHYYHRIP